MKPPRPRNPTRKTNHHAMGSRNAAATWRRLFEQTQMELDRVDAGTRQQLGTPPWQLSKQPAPSAPSLISVRQAKVRAALLLLAPTDTTSLSLGSTAPTASTTTVTTPFHSGANPSSSDPESLLSPKPTNSTTRAYPLYPWSPKAPSTRPPAGAIRSSFPPGRNSRK